MKTLPVSRSLVALRRPVSPVCPMPAKSASYPCLAAPTRAATDVDDRGFRTGAPAAALCCCSFWGDRRRLLGHSRSTWGQTCWSSWLVDIAWSDSVSRMCPEWRPPSDALRGSQVGDRR